MPITVTAQMIETYQQDGVVLIKGLWADWVTELQAGVARNMAGHCDLAIGISSPGRSVMAIGA